MSLSILPGFLHGSRAGSVGGGPAALQSATWSGGNSVGFQMQLIKTELSGLASAQLAVNATARLGWGVDDGGTLVALDFNDGSDMGDWTNAAFSAGDWEDVATRIVDGTAYVYVGHFGDNASSRAGNYFIYRCEEEDMTGGAGGTFATVEAIEYQYPASPTGPNGNAKRDTEAMIIDTNGDIYLFSKRESALSPPGTRVFMIAHQATYSGVQTAVYMGTIDLTKLPADSVRGYTTTVAGADLSPDGRELLIKNYEEIRHWSRATVTGTSFWDMMNNSSPTLIVGYPGNGDPQIMLEPQGESVCFDAEGVNYFTISELVGGDPVVLLEYARTTGAYSTATLEHGVDGVTGTFTYIDAAAPDATNNTAVLYDIDSGPSARQGFIKFAGLSSGLPANAVIVGGYLSLTEPAGQSGSGVQVQELLQDFAAGNTWNNSWGGDGVDSNDVEAASKILGQYGLGAAGSAVGAGEIRLSVPAALMQQWYDGGTNRGLLLNYIPAGATGLEPATFANATSGDRPKLVVEYIAPPPETPPTASVTTPTAGTSETTEAVFVVTLAAGTQSIDDATVVAGTVILQKNAVTQVLDTDYSFAYDSGAKTITLTSIGGNFALDSYTIELNGAVPRIADSLGLELVNVTLNVSLGVTYASLVQATQGGNLLGYWRLGEASGTLLDETANNVDSQSETGITYSVAASLYNDADTACSFAGGAGDGVLLEASPGSDLRAAQFTVMCRFKRTGTGATTSGGTGLPNPYEPIFSKGRGEGESAGVNLNWMIGFDLTNIFGGYEESAGAGRQIIGGTAISNDVWYHATFTYDGSNMKLYLNGVSDATQVAEANGPDSASQQRAGIATAYNSSGAAAGGFLGVIDECSIWDVALSAAEVLALYDKSVAPPVPIGNVPYFDAGVDQGDLGDQANRNEISGIAASVKSGNNGWLYGIDDTDDQVLYIIGEDGSDQGELDLTAGPTWVDGESVAIGKLGGTGGADTIFIGDIGDNSANRTDCSIFRVVEPALTGSTVVVAVGDIEQIAIDYPASPAGEPGSTNNARDAEALLVDPFTGDMYVITKRIGNGTPSTPAQQQIWYLAHQASYTGTQTLTYIGLTGAFFDYDFNGFCVAGTVSPNGKEIMLKSYDKVYIWQRVDGTISIGDLLQLTPTNSDVTYVGFGNHPTQEPQGEAITFASDGVDYFTLSEASGGSGPSSHPLFRYARSTTVPEPTITFQTGVAPSASYAGVDDTYMWETSPATVRGGESTVVVDENVGNDRRGLIKFDLSLVPTNARVTAVSFNFEVTVSGLGHDMHVMLTAWDENTTYTSNGGAHFAINDVDAESAIDATWPGDLGNTGSYSTTIPISTVQDWLDGIITNEGWLFWALDPDGQQLASSENGTAGFRPELVVTYTFDEP